jgi:MarR family transcriptional repressor of emrRAB
VATSFAPFESAIERVAKRRPGAPRQEILLTRLYHHIDNRLAERYNESLKPHGINQTIWLTLIMLYSSPDHAIKPSDLSVCMDSSRTNATRLADELVARGWVERRPCSKDRRQLFLSLTPDGIRFVEELLPEQRQLHRSFWTSFTKAEKSTMEALLRKLLKQLGG